MIYENDFLYFFWKPSWLASTRWKNESILDLIKSKTYSKFIVLDFDQNILTSTSMSSIAQWVMETIWMRLLDNTLVDSILEKQMKEFSHQEEFGMLNRIDNDTSWFLYFAKNREVYESFGWWQDKKLISKYYLAQVYGNPGWLVDHGCDYDEVEIVNDVISVRFPLMHHEHLSERMVALTSPKKMSTWRWAVLYCETEIRVLSFDKESNTSLIQAVIHEWKRHQIRAHCSGLWYPIIGDVLYSKKWSWEEFPKLHLWSVWCEINYG